MFVCPSHISGLGFQFMPFRESCKSWTIGHCPTIENHGYKPKLPYTWHDDELSTIWNFPQQHFWRWQEWQGSWLLMNGASPPRCDLARSWLPSEALKTWRCGVHVAPRQIQCLGIKFPHEIGWFWDIALFWKKTRISGAVVVRSVSSTLRQNSHAQSFQRW